MIPATDDLIALACKSLAEEFEADNTVPGMVIAHLRPEKSPTGKACFYVAARRYDKDLEVFGNGLVVAKSYNEDLDVAVREVVKALAVPVQHQATLSRVAARLPEVES